MASFFLPCSFPLLATLLARGRGVEQGEAGARLLRSGLALAAGVTVFFLLAGTGIALGAASLQIKRWSGVVLLLVGAWSIALAIWAEFSSRIFPLEAYPDVHPDSAHFLTR